MAPNCSQRRTPVVGESPGDALCSHLPASQLLTLSPALSRRYPVFLPLYKSEKAGAGSGQGSDLEFPFSPWRLCLPESRRLTFRADSCYPWVSPGWGQPSLPLRPRVQLPHEAFRARLVSDEASAGHPS